MDRIIAYQKRLQWQLSQRKAMDRHLVHLVRQTELYAGELAERLKNTKTAEDIKEIIVVRPASRNLMASAGSQRPEPQKKRINVSKNREREPSGLGSSGLSLTVRLAAADARARETDVARPFLLDNSVKLRLYQQAGLNWLVSMHERRLNGILADEMGLGKTLQTISLLAHLAAQKGLWGPHLVVAPTSCLVNWESELKRFCPGLKIVTYYGTAKARKQLRAGWSRASAVHVIVTSYQLAVQDASIFRRKKFYFLILDEAHNIKNFDSRRWRTLLAFQAQRRLLLTGTPLQNSLMELWSLMHFLMPHLFRSRHEFSYWFANPLQVAVEGKSKMSEELVKRLHSIMRPFVLRRLKKDVAKQLPGKYEHDVHCKLSRRQQLLYEEFMARSSTRCAMEGTQGRSSFVSMMNVVMQLRKVCNHPDLFEPRAVIAPLLLPQLVQAVPSLIHTAVVDVTIGGIDGCALCQIRLDEDPLPLESARSLMAPAAFVHHERLSLFLEDISINAATGPQSMNRSSSNQWHVHSIVERNAVAILARHVAKSANMLGATAPSNISFSTRALLARSFQHSAPLKIAWDAIMSRDHSIGSKHAFPNDERRQLRANRQSLVASDLLQQHLELHATVSARCQNLDELIRRFAFVVPMAISPIPRLSVMLPALNMNSATGFAAAYHTPNVEDVAACCDYTLAIMEPIHHIALALQVSFPDRSLIQWDSGKFHELAPLLRRLKTDAHRCLIFTQMSKMLDILEAFLCWHGHSYLRLDGGTAPGERQRLMDRFNSDASIFCFVLSTRSGGLGINLTGADTVIFYDSDWNPAMDAQAMDRAHRIGQTRDVHIYRLVCIATVEENILLKARQKQKLELVAITEGNFDSFRLQEQETDRTSGQKLLSTQCNDALHDGEIATAMAELEDIQDVAHARAAAAEAASADREFDENARIDLDPENDDDNTARAIREKKNAEDEAAREVAAMEAEFAAWQERVGPDPESLTQSLSAVERMALFEHEICMTKCSSEIVNNQSFLTLAERRLVETIEKENSEGGSILDVNEIDALNRTEEHRACSDGELLATDVYLTDDSQSLANVNRDEHEFLRRRRLALLAKCERECTGAAWETRIDAMTNDPFWYNIDTAEATWLKPLVLQRRDADAEARSGGYGSWPNDVSGRVIAMCQPGPTRCACALVCRKWANACLEDHLFVHVLPVERLDESHDASKKSTLHTATKFSAKRACNPVFVSRQHKTKSILGASLTLAKPLQNKTRVPLSQPRLSLRSAVETALPGETLVLGPGHYWEDGADLVIEANIRLIGDSRMPDRVTVELGGALCWRANRGTLAGLTLRRPRACTETTSALVIQRGFVACHRIVIDNFGCGGAAVVVQGGACVHLDRTTVLNATASAVFLQPGARATLSRCNLNNNGHCGLSVSPDAVCFLKDCTLRQNRGAHVVALAGSAVALKCNQLTQDSENSILTRSFIQEPNAFVVAKRNLGVDDT